MAFLGSRRTGGRRPRLGVRGEPDSDATRVTGEIGDAADHRRTDGKGRSTVRTGAQAIGVHIAPRITEAARAAGRPAPRVVTSAMVATTDDPDRVRRGVHARLPSAGQRRAGAGPYPRLLQPRHHLQRRHHLPAACDPRLQRRQTKLGMSSQRRGLGWGGRERNCRSRSDRDGTVNRCGLRRVRLRWGKPGQREGLPSP